MDNDRPLAADEYWVVEDKDGNLVQNPGSMAMMLSKSFAFATGFKDRCEKVRRARITVEVVE